MKKLLLYPLASLVFIQFTFGLTLSRPSLAQEWTVRGKPQGTLKVVSLAWPWTDALVCYFDSLVNLDKDNNYVPSLAEDWRWLDDRTIEFKLREGVRFHNGEKFNAEAVRVNWEEYRKLKAPRYWTFEVIPEETKFEIIDEYTVRFTLPKPDAFALPKFWVFGQFAPEFFESKTFEEANWGFLSEPGPWGAGPFQLVEGTALIGRPSPRIVLKAFEGYWDRRYPKVETIILENSLIGDRDEAMRLCREEEGAVDIVSHIRPLDTLKVAESPFAKVVKSRDVACLRGLYNMRKKDSKFRDIRVRKALNYALNHKELWKYGAKGNAYNLGGYIPPGEYGHNPDVEHYTYDTEKARALLAEAGYPEGFEVNIMTPEWLKLETQIISRMLERISLKPIPQILTDAECFSRICISLLDRPPEEIDWDFHLYTVRDYWANPGLSFLPWNYIQESDMLWIEYDPAYEKMWKEMINTIDLERQEEKIQQMVQYLYDNAYALFIYSPITLYAANKEVDLVPYRSGYVRLKETSVTDGHWSIREENQ